MKMRIFTGLFILAACFGSTASFAKKTELQVCSDKCKAQFKKDNKHAALQICMQKCNEDSGELIPASNEGDDATDKANDEKDI
ncbi:MAG: hypothetical protein ACXVBE_18100 [Bdellovibrionota bacterium]